MHEREDKSWCMGKDNMTSTYLKARLWTRGRLIPSSAANWVGEASSDLCREWRGAWSINNYCLSLHLCVTGVVWTVYLWMWLNPNSIVLRGWDSQPATLPQGLRCARRAYPPIINVDAQSQEPRNPYDLGRTKGGKGAGKVSWLPKGAYAPLVVSCMILPLKEPQAKNRALKQFLVGQNVQEAFLKRSALLERSCILLRIC